MADTNYSSLDVTDGYKVDGVQIIDWSGNIVWNINAPAWSIWTTEIASNAITTIKITDWNVTNAKLWVPKLVTYQETVLYSAMVDGGGASWTKALSTSIPEGAVFVQSFIDAVTWFAWDVSAVITIGDGTDVDRYNTWTPSVFATADHVSAWVPSGTIYHSAAKTPTITVTTNADFTSVSAWQVTITIMYYQSI